MRHASTPPPITPSRRAERPQDARKPLGRYLLPLAALALLSGLTAPEAKAQWTVIDPAHIAKTVWNGRKIVDQVRNQAEQIRNEVEMLRRLPEPPWREIRARVAELEEVMRAGEALAFSMDGLLDEFGVTFPGFRDYADWSAERRAQFDRSLQTLANSLMGLQQQGQQIALSQAELDRIKAMRASGQTSATELGNTIGAFAAEELVLLRQLIAVQANAQAVAAAQRINDEAQRAAAQEARIRAMADYEPPHRPGLHRHLLRRRRLTSTTPPSTRPMTRIPQTITFALCALLAAVSGGRLVGCAPSVEDVAEGDDPLAALTVGAPSERYGGRYWLLKRDEDRSLFDEALAYCEGEEEAERLAEHPNCGPVIAAARFAESRERPRPQGRGFTGILSEDAAAYERDTAGSGIPADTAGSR